MDCSVYETLKFAGARLAHRESNLYVKADPLSRRVLKEVLAGNRLFGRPSLFLAEDGSGLWYEIPFAYEPYWLARGA